MNYAQLQEELRGKAPASCAGGLAGPCIVLREGAADLDGFLAAGLARALSMTPAAVIAEVNAAGLKGRGGAGFPTGTKWQICRDAPGEVKYVICNAAEGDPGSAAVRLLFENNPYGVLEGMLIAAWAVGAARGYIYVNAANAPAVERALARMAGRGLLGDDILDSGFACHVDLHVGTGGFAGGGETAMIRELEGRPAMSYSRPPYPAVAGLYGKPTCVNSAETLAHAAAILQKGAGWYAGTGSGESHGTKLLTLSGSVVRPGVVEVPMGTTMRQIVDEIGGGMPDGREPKGVLIGGPAGGCLPADSLDLPLDYEPLAAAGAVMGSGGVFVADAGTCMVDLALQCLTFTRAASCGKCVMCREGTRQMKSILADMTQGRARLEDIDLLLELGEGMQAGSLCGLGKTAPNPVLTAIRYFRPEFEAHVRRKRCPALVCKKYITYHILGDRCRGCGRCLEECPAGAVAGGEGMIHVIDQDECTKCGTCQEMCPPEFGAVTRAGAVKPRTPARPVPVGSWKR